MPRPFIVIATIILPTTKLLTIHSSRPRVHTVIFIKALARRLTPTLCTLGLRNFLNDMAGYYSLTQSMYQTPKLIIPDLGCSRAPSGTYKVASLHLLSPSPPCWASFSAFTYTITITFQHISTLSIWAGLGTV